MSDDIKTGNMGREKRNGNGPVPVTMADVARHAKLSRATVSKVINNSGYVRPKTVARVHEVINALGYRPNEMARSLVRQRSYTLGVIFPSNSDPWTSEIMEYMQPLARKHGYRLILYPASRTPADILSSVDSLLSWRVEGILSFVPLEDALLKEIYTRDIKLVLWDFPHDTNPRLSFVCVDIDVGMSRVATYLTRLGHRRIAYVGRSDQETTKSLVHIFEQAITHAAPDAKLLLKDPSDHSVEAGAEAITQMLASEALSPTAVLCRNDTLAMGVLYGLDRAGLRVPEDVSVVGINDVHYSRFTKPPLTTLRVSTRTVTERMIGLVLAALNGEEMPAYQSIIPELVVRESTAPAP